MLKRDLIAAAQHDVAGRKLDHLAVGLDQRPRLLIEGREQAIAGEGLISLDQFVGCCLCHVGFLRAGTPVSFRGWSGLSAEQCTGHEIAPSHRRPKRRRSSGRAAGSRRRAEAGRHRPGFAARRSDRRRRGRCRDIRRPLVRLNRAVDDEPRSAVLEAHCRPSAVSTAIVHSSPSLRRQSRLAVSGPSACGLANSSRRRSVSAHSSGKLRSADFTNRPPGKILVAIEKALIPGSNTPKPPGSQIHCWPGMPFVHVLVPEDRHRLDALAGQRLGGGSNASNGAARARS